MYYAREVIDCIGDRTFKKFVLILYIEIFKKILKDQLIANFRFEFSLTFINDYIATSIPINHSKWHNKLIAVIWIDYNH